MGSAASAAVPPPPPPAQAHAGAPPYGPGLAGILPPRPQGEEKVDYLNLPCPVPFEEIQREALSSSPYPSSFYLLNQLVCVKCCCCGIG